MYFGNQFRFDVGYRYSHESRRRVSTALSLDSKSDVLEKSSSRDVIFFLKRHRDKGELRPIFKFVFLTIFQLLDSDNYKNTLFGAFRGVENWKGGQKDAPIDPYRDMDLLERHF